MKEPYEDLHMTENMELKCPRCEMPFRAQGTPETIDLINYVRMNSYYEVLHCPACRRIGRTLRLGAPGMEVYQHTPEIKEVKRRALIGWDENAQLECGVRHMEGWGAEKIPLQGYAWIYCAFQQGKEGAQEELELLERRIGPQEAAKGQALAETLKVLSMTHTLLEGKLKPDTKDLKDLLKNPQAARELGLDADILHILKEHGEQGGPAKGPSKEKAN